MASVGGVTNNPPTLHTLHDQVTSSTELLLGSKWYRNNAVEGTLSRRGN